MFVNIADEDVVEEARQGNQEGWAELMQRHYDSMSRYFTTKIVDLQTAKDLTQQTFLEAYQHLNLQLGQTVCRMALLSCTTQLSTFFYFVGGSGGGRANCL